MVTYAQAQAALETAGNHARLQPPAVCGLGITEDGGQFKLVVYLLESRPPDTPEVVGGVDVVYEENQGLPVAQ